MDSGHSNCLVLDVGKTNVKVHIVDEQYESLATFVRQNKTVNDIPYPQADIDGIWQWVLGVLRTAAAEFDVKSIVVTAHGATAALVDTTLGDNGLVLPVMDYEWSGVESVDESYDRIRPSFQETYSPNLPGGLNIGRQLFWQEQHFPKEFESADALLMYPQYWTWRLSGKLVSEVSSLGCHTDLWSPIQGDYSSLVASQSWTRLFPSAVPAWTEVGPVAESVVAETGISGECGVYAGVHDSNASLLRFLLAKPEQEFCVVSSGTWVVCMSTESSLQHLDSSKDMLANVDVRGNPVPCIRFMGGREYANICKQTDSGNDRSVIERDVAQIVADGVMALPNFSDGSGPFAARRAEIRGVPHSGAALATVYCALMVDHCLDLLDVQGDILIEGAFLNNPMLCRLVAQLRSEQSVYLSGDHAGTVRGAALLANWSEPVSLAWQRCEASEIEGLRDYWSSWHKHIGGIS